MNPSDHAMTLLKQFEGFSPTPYRCSSGKLTIGHGHVIQAHDQFTKPMSVSAADALLRTDVDRFARSLETLLELPVLQHQFDAMLLLMYNIGYGAFSASTLLKRVNSGDMKLAADEFMRWNKITNPKTGQKEPLAGLTKRRAVERKLFLGKPG